MRLGLSFLRAGFAAAESLLLGCNAILIWLPNSNGVMLARVIAAGAVLILPLALLGRR
jgi:hypothetical protein